MCKNQTKLMFNRDWVINSWKEIVSKKCLYQMKSNVVLKAWSFVWLCVYCLWYPSRKLLVSRNILINLFFFLQINASISNNGFNTTNPYNSSKNLIGLKSWIVPRSNQAIINFVDWTFVDLQKKLKAWP